MSDVIDSHVHVWDPARYRYPWLDSEPDLNRPMLPQDLDVHPLSALVVVEAGCLPRQGLAEARWVSSLNSRWPQIQAVVAHADVDHGRAVGAQLEHLRTIERVRGVRRPFHSESPAFFEEPALLEGLDQIARAGLVFDACVHHEQLGMLAGLVEQSPHLQFVLDHLGKPPVDTGWGSPEAKRWYSDLAELARQPNVSVKLSGLPAESARPQLDLRELRGWIDAGLDAFGAERCMVGSDWPVSSRVASTGGRREWFDFVLGTLGGRERGAVAGGTAARVYGIGPQSGSGS